MFNFSGLWSISLINSLSIILIFQFFLLPSFASLHDLDVQLQPNSRKDDLTKRKVNYRYLCLSDDGEAMKREKHLGVACKCPSIYAPVCGSDNITYDNRCVLHCRAKHSKDLYQKYRLVLKKFGEC